MPISVDLLRWDGGSSEPYRVALHQDRQRNQTARIEHVVRKGLFGLFSERKFVLVERRNLKAWDPRSTELSPNVRINGYLDDGKKVAVEIEPGKQFQNNFELMGLRVIGVTDAQGRLRSPVPWMNGRIPCMLRVTNTRPE